MCYLCIVKQKDMKATYTHNGKKFIYKVDGKQVRTSQKATPYEFVAVRLYDGDFVGIIACGQYKTCAQYLTMDADIVSRCEITLNLVRGDINYSTYLNRIGFTHAMTKDYFREIVDGGKKDEYIDRYEKMIADHSRYSTVILPFVAE
jgi:hypothetical protein